MANTVFLNLVNRVDSLIETVENSNNAAIQEVRDRTDGLVYYSRAWADSDTNPDPTDPDSKSAKGWAEVASQVATEAEIKLEEAVTACEDAVVITTAAVALSEASATTATTAANTANTRANAASEAADAAIAAASRAADTEALVVASALAAQGQAADAAASASSANSSRGSALSSASAAALSAGSANDARVATQNLMDTFANFRFLGKVEWWQGNPAMIPAGFLPINGQLLNRADYPDLWSDISNGVFVSVTDAAWLGSSGVRAKFSTGNGTTTFRMPDLNGVQSGSLKGLYLRGMGAAGLTPSAGDVLGDAIRNITANFLTRYGVDLSAGGAISVTNGAATGDALTVSASENPSRNMVLNASTQVPTASENRPVSAVGTWIMLVNGAPARQFNPETSAGLGSNTFGGLQKFNAGFEWVGVVPQLIQTDIDQGLTDAQKLRAANNIGAVVYGQTQALTEGQKAQTRNNLGLGSVSTMDTIPVANGGTGATTAAQARNNLGLGNFATINTNGDAGLVFMGNGYQAFRSIASIYLRHNELGSVAWATTSQGQYGPGNAIAGGNLRPAGMQSDGNGANPIMALGGGGFYTGTWQCLGFAAGIPAQKEGASLWIKIGV